MVYSSRTRKQKENELATDYIVHLSARSYERMLKDEGIAVMEEERRRLSLQNQMLESDIRANNRNITALTSTIAALQLVDSWKES